MVQDMEIYSEGRKTFFDMFQHFMIYNSVLEICRDG